MLCWWLRHADTDGQLLLLNMQVHVHRRLESKEAVRPRPHLPVTILRVVGRTQCLADSCKLCQSRTAVCALGLLKPPDKEQTKKLVAGGNENCQVAYSCRLSAVAVSSWQLKCPAVPVGMASSTRRCTRLAAMTAPTHSTACSGATRTALSSCRTSLRCLHQRQSRCTLLHTATR